jgi:hypothetical protein
MQALPRVSHEHHDRLWHKAVESYLAGTLHNHVQKLH